MKDNQLDTPPSSINGDEITPLEEDEIIYYDDDLDPIDWGDDELEVDENMEELTEQEIDAQFEKPEDLSVLVFNKHAGSVFCCDITADGSLAATGGEDDKAYVWSVESGEIILECGGHKDSVIFIGFSFDGAYLATADMGGLIKVWKCSENGQQWPLSFEYEAGDLNWGLWHFGAHVLICGGAAGDIYVFKIPSGETKVLQGHNSRVECSKLFQDGLKLAAGYDDGVVKVWDLKTCAVIHQLPANVHQMRVTAIDTHFQNNLMASISNDGNVVLTTLLNGKIVGQLEAENDLETIAFTQDSQEGYFALGTLNGSVSIWDPARQMVRHQCSKTDEENVSGVTKMIWVNNNLLTGCLDGSVRIYDGKSGGRLSVLTGHWSEVLDLCYNAKKNVILTTSDDGTARIFKYDVEKDKD